MARPTTLFSLPPPLGRESFTAAVLARDGHACVLCGAREGAGVRLDAHHILERRLWPDGGYHLDNGATVCDQGPEGCHMRCERTDVSVEDLRLACGIARALLPPDLYEDQVYDKWGNIVLPNGQRMRGPLFHDPSVQKVIAHHLHLFTPFVKHPRTWHLPWSPGATSDDRILAHTTAFEGEEVVVTRKMDGEQFSGYRTGCHARSVDGRGHPSRDWAKRAWAERAHDLPEGWRVTCENLYAVHSLRYTDLPSFLMGFMVWDDSNTCLSWDDTVLWFGLLDLPVVDVLYRGPWDPQLIRDLHTPQDDAAHEGYVVRVAKAFPYQAFSRSVAKYVRAHHVTTDRHWMQGRRIEANGLASTR